jgi:hypothetical protein
VPIDSAYEPQTASAAPFAQPAPESSAFTGAHFEFSNVGDTSDMRFFIGKNQDYYMDRFQKMDSVNSKNSWNWCGFLFGPYWMAYRKMYKPALIFTALCAVLPFIPWTVISGIRGNHIYKDHVNNCLQEAKKKAPLERERYLVQNGGTNIGAAIGFYFALIAIIAGLYILILSLIFGATFLSMIFTSGNQSYTDSEYGYVTEGKYDEIWDILSDEESEPYSEDESLAENVDSSFEEDLLVCFTVDAYSREMYEFYDNFGDIVNLATFSDLYDTSVLYIAHKEWMVYTEGSKLNIRSEPSMDAIVIGQYADGDVLNSTGRVVVYEDGTFFLELGALYSESWGWVSLDYVLPFFE